MAETDKTSFVSHRLAAVLEGCKGVDGKLGDYLVDSDERPDLVPELFEMLNSADDLVELASPSKTSGEYHGLPKSATTTEFSRIVFTHTENPDWDFAAWYGEKVSELKFHVKLFIGYWGMDHRRLETRSPSPEVSREYIRRGLQSSLSAVRRYAEVVFDEVVNGRLEIREIRAGESL